MKKKTAWILAFAALALVLLALVLVLNCTNLGYYLEKELDYHFGEPTKAQQIVHDHARKTRVFYGQYPDDLIQLLENNPETIDFVLGYPRRDEMASGIPYDKRTVPLFLQWDPNWGYEIYGSSFLAVTGCGPTCLAMAACHLTGDETLLPDQMARFAEERGYYVPGVGSAWALMGEGARELGLTSEELPLEEAEMTAALEAGKLLILSMGPGDFTSAGHFILLTGVEEGGFRVNDPNSIVRSQRLWTFAALEDQIRNIWAIGKHDA